jgi:hypothetical protein
MVLSKCKQTNVRKSYSQVLLHAFDAVDEANRVFL